MTLGRGRYKMVRAAAIRDDEGVLIFDINTPILRGLYGSPKGEIAALVPLLDMTEPELREAKKRAREAAQIKLEEMTA